MRYPLIIVSSLALASCASNKLTPEIARGIIQEFHAAGCGGTFDLSAGFDTGQLGGTARAALDISASCPVGDKPETVRVITMPNLTEDDIPTPSS